MIHLSDNFQFAEHSRQDLSTKAVLKMLIKGWLISLLREFPVQVAIISKGERVPIAQFRRGRPL